MSLSLQIGSRVVFVTAGAMLVFFGVLGKVGAVLVLIPDPIVGGTLLLGLGMVASIGISGKPSRCVAVVQKQMLTRRLKTGCFFLYFDKMFATTFVDLYRIVFRENSHRSRSTQYTYVTILNRRSNFNKMIYQ